MLVPNPYLDRWQQEFERFENRGDVPVRRVDADGPSIGQIPGSIVSAPVLVRDGLTGVEHELRFVAGMLGVRQDESSRALAAAFGWAVIYDGEAERAASAAACAGAS